MSRWQRPRAPSVLVLRASAARLREEMLGGVRLLLATCPLAVAEWFVGQMQLAVDEAERLLWMPELRRRTQPRPRRQVVCFICRDPQEVTRVYPFGHVCPTCDWPELEQEAVDAA